jgi:hypothetical protein
MAALFVLFRSAGLLRKDLLRCRDHRKDVGRVWRVSNFAVRDQKAVEAHSGECPVAGHVEEGLPVVFRLDFRRPAKTLVGKLSVFVGRAHWTSLRRSIRESIKRRRSGIFGAKSYIAGIFSTAWRVKRHRAANQEQRPEIRRRHSHSEDGIDARHNEHGGNSRQDYAHTANESGFRPSHACLRDSI